MPFDVDIRSIEIFDSNKQQNSFAKKLEVAQCQVASTRVGSTGVVRLFKIKTEGRSTMAKAAKKAAKKAPAKKAVKKVAKKAAKKKK